MYLPSETLLNSRYEVETVLGHGGFGITYAAHDKLLNVKVAIKEYLPRQLATRGEGQTRVSVFTGEARQQYYYGLQKFLEEAQSMARFAHHPNVVSARDYFEGNGTAYMVMEYVEGVTFKEYLENKGGRISFEEAKAIMMPVMDALREVHQAGMLHRDISPDNIYITTKTQVKILDFGAARYFTGEQSKSLSVILKSGYAPEEQYRSKGKQGAWTDIYATAATLYKAITGETPAEALDRVVEDTLVPPSRLGVVIPTAAEQALLKALAVNAGQRFQDMGEFQQALQGGDPMTTGFQTGPFSFRPASGSGSEPGYTPVLAQPSAQPSHYPQLPRRSVNPAAIAAGVIVAIILGVGLIWWQVARNPSQNSNGQSQKVEGQKPVIGQPAPPHLVQAAAPPSSLPYVMGGIFSITGPASYLGEPEKNSMEMVVKEINVKGGINGHPLKLVIYDDEGDVTKARLHVEKLLQKDNALAIVGPSLTHTSISVLEITQKAKVPLISCAAGSAITSPAKDRSWVFKMAQTDQMAVSRIYQYLQKKNLKKVAILTVSTGFGVSGKQQLMELASKYGIQVVAQEIFGEKDADMTSQLIKLRNTTAQAVICWGTGPAPVLVAKNMKQMGMTIPLIQSHGAASKRFIQLAGDAGEGILMPAGKLVIWQQLPDNDPQKAVCKEYAEKYQSKFKSMESSFGGYAYDAIRMLNQALAKAGNNRDKIRSELESIKNFVGISGIFNISPEDHHGLSPAAFVMVKIHNGRFQLVD